ncbi:MAG TPA: hypothetical protein VN461_20990 [Vicinamibacteria bacterium]|jgi:hypothetical protein|nr:hypothetical protein [Vicinamibacteria bacterium]
MSRLFLIGILALQPGILFGQSLGEAAAQEKARREKKEKDRPKDEATPRVYTNTDLRKPEDPKESGQPTGGAPSSSEAVPVSRESMNWSGRSKPRRPAATSPEGAPAPSGEGASEETTSTGYTADEGEWRRQSAERRREVASLKARVEAMQSNVNRLLGDIMQANDPNLNMRLRAEQQQAIEQLEALKKELADAEKGIQDFAEEARRAGVPPGWVREP